METLADFSSEQLVQERRGFIFIGPEGSGKTTQARLLAEELGKPLIGVGDLLRDRAKNDTGPIGEACRAMFNEHTYLDPKLLIQIVTERLAEDDTVNGFILDGGNRTVEETEHFPETLKLAGRDNVKISVISLRLSGWRAMGRLTVIRKRSDDTVEGSLNRLGKFYHRLGERASIMRNQWGEILQVSAWNPIDEEILVEQDEERKKDLIKLSSEKIHQSIVSRIHE